MLAEALGAVIRRSSDTPNPEDPRQPLEPWWLLEALGAVRTSSGVRVNEQNALNIAAVYAAVTVATDTVASLPLMLYRRLERGKERANTHWLWPVLHDRANREMPAFLLKEVLQGHLETWGNAYSEIERDGAGRVIGLWPLLPDRTGPQRVNGQKSYVTRLANGQTVVLPGSRVMHIVGFGFDGLVGKSRIKLARESLGLAKAAETYGSVWFSNGAQPGGALEHPGKLTPTARTNLRESWKQMHEGLGNAHRVAILEEGMKWHQIGVPPEDSQFLETRRFQVKEIARWFRIPLHMMAEETQAPAANVEQTALDFLKYSLRPRLVRIEQTVNWDLVPQGQLFAEFFITALLRGDSQTRSEFYTKMVNIGALTPNDVLEAENLNGFQGGDRHYMQVNMAAIGEDGSLPPAPQAPAARELAAALAGLMGERSLPALPSGIQRTTDLGPVFRDAAERCLTREIKAAEAALKKGGDQEFREWTERFYASHEGYIAEAFRAPLQVEGFGRDPSAVASAWVNRSRGALRGLTSKLAVELCLDHWRRERLSSEVAAARGEES